MADTRVQHEAERWVVQWFLPTLYPDTRFSGKKMELRWGGQFSFDAVSADESIVVCISTSAAFTARGKQATAKIQKLKTDALYLLNLKNPARLVMVFSEASMRDHFLNCQRIGRFSPDIELVHSPLPPTLQERVVHARSEAARETTPVNGREDR